ncbi:MAG: CHRD domain-containing protein [Pseudomonadales bacterium]|nr:CHRD domain-containing protein [Pseudomonadales bacterium]
MKLGRLFSLFLFSLSVTLVSMSVQAQEVYRARLSPMPTTPQSVADITGEGEVILTLNGNALAVEGNFSGISSATTMGHIHNGPPAQPGPVVHRLEVTAAPNGNISAELELTDEQVSALRNNELYVQIHSENNAPGELRGWIFLRSHFES